MGIFNKIKNKASSTLGDEILSTAEVKKEEKPKQKAFAKKDINAQLEALEFVEEDESKTIKQISESMAQPTSKSVNNILSMLSIPQERDIKRKEVTAEAIRGVNFTVTTPHGFSHVEVENFVNLVENAVAEYEEIVALRNREIVRLAQEVARIEKNTMEVREANEMQSMMGDNQVEELMDQIMTLTLEKKELNKKLNEFKDKVKNLDENRVKALMSENEYLKLRNAELLKQLEETGADVKPASNDIAITPKPQPSLPKPSLPKPGALSGIPKPPGSVINKDDFDSLLDELEEE